MAMWIFTKAIFEGSPIQVFNGGEMRRDFKRHSVEPGQDQLQKEVVGPLAEAARKIDARLRELDRKDPLAPVGRDPVPDRYNDLVRRYFEELGK